MHLTLEFSILVNQLKYVPFPTHAHKLHYVYKKRISRFENKSKGVLIFVHGFPSYWFCWKKQITYFTNLGYDVVCPDLRGYNQSEMPILPWRYKLQYLVDDMCLLIRDLEEKGILSKSGSNSEISKPVVIGHDWGGVVTTQFCYEHPEMLKHHILINSTAFKIWDKLVFSNLGQYLKSYYVFGFQIPLLPELMLCNYRFFSKLGGPNNLSKHNLLGNIYGFKHFYKFTGGINYYRCNFLWYGVWSFLFDQVNYQKVFGSWTKIKTKCSIIWGKNDKYLSLPMAQMNADLYENCEVRFLNAGHWLIEENHGTVNNLIEQALK